jgi:hypothetical protein
MSALAAGPRLAIGFALAAVGTALAAFAAAGALNAAAGMQVVALAAGLTLVFAGALMVSSLALAFDWIAFGPGERQFTGSVGVAGAAVSSAVGEPAGRVFFGLFALLFDIAAIGLWLRLIRGPRSQ